MHMRLPYNLIHAMLTLVVSTPARMAEEEESFDKRESDGGVRFALFVWWEELEFWEEFFLVLDDIKCKIR